MTRALAAPAVLGISFWPAADAYAAVIAAGGSGHGTDDSPQWTAASVGVHVAA